MQMYIKAKFLSCVNNISDGRAVAHLTSQVGSTRDVRSNPHKGKAYIERGAGGGRSSGVPTPMYMPLAYDHLNILFLF